MREDGEERDRDDTPQPVAGPVVVVRGDGHEVPLCRVADLGSPDLATVDALARLQLAARRRGWSIALAGPGDELGRLQELIGLVGLADVLDGPGPTPRPA